MLFPPALVSTWTDCSSVSGLENLTSPLAVRMFPPSSTGPAAVLDHRAACIEIGSPGNGQRLGVGKGDSADRGGQLRIDVDRLGYEPNAQRAADVHGTVERGRTHAGLLHQRRRADGREIHVAGTENGQSTQRVHAAHVRGKGHSARAGRHQETVRAPRDAVHGRGEEDVSAAAVDQHRRQIAQPAARERSA